MDFTIKILLIIILILMSAFFSASEIALASSRITKLQTLIDEGDERAKTIIKTQEHAGDFFAAIQVGINAVAILGGIIGDKILNPYVESFIKNVFPNASSNALIVGNVLSFIFVTFLFIQFADFIPKRLAMVYPEKIALKTVGTMIVIMKILKPFIRLIDGIAVIIFKIFKLEIIRQDKITHEDIVALVDAGAEAGIVHKKEHSLIENIFELETRWVTSIMTPRDDIPYISVYDSEEEVKKNMREHPNRKFLICGHNLDDILGTIDSKDLLPVILDGDTNIIKFIRDFYKKDLLVIPNTLTVSDTLDQFNEKKDDFAVILNEYSHVTGIVTLYDVIGTVVDRVVYSKEEDLQVIQRDEHSWLIDGLTPIEDVKKALEIYEKFPEEDTYETIAGFMMYMLKTIPKKGAKVEYFGYVFEVVDVDSFKIDQLLVIQKNKNLI